MGFQERHTRRRLPLGDPHQRRGGVILIGAVAFHAVFGIRTMMIDSGWIRTADRLTIPFVVIAAAVTVWGAVIAL